MFGINDNNQSTNSAPADNGASPTPLPPSPFMDNQGDPGAQQSDAPAPAPPNPPADPTSPASPPPPALTPASEDLLVGLKEQALNNLAPLVNHLEQSPEERFKTTMMLIQASDNSSLIKDAYEAANKITDEKTRAQALLDVVNEINYFTQKNNPAAGEAPKN